MQAKQWQHKGQWVEINGFKHFYYDSGTDLPVLLILHGYPTCTYDFHKALPYLEQNHRVVMHDHLGFGFSEKPLNYSYALFEQTDQALLLWQHLGISEASVLAHDYGTSLATELLARIQRSYSLHIDIKQLVLCNGSMHVELAQLRLIQKLLLNPFTGPLVSKLSSRRTLAKNLRNIYHDPRLLNEAEIDALWLMMNHGGGRQVLHRTTQYIKERYRFWHRWIGALKSTQMLTHIVWAENDPVAVVDMAYLLSKEIPNNSLTILKNLGHYPMLENPKVWAEAVVTHLQA